MMRINVFTPSLEEQHRIASFLDSKCSEIDALTADIQKEIETLQEYRKSVITEAVTKGLDPNVEMKDSGIEWIGEIPIHWKITSLGKISSFKTGGTPSTTNPKWFDGDLIWYNPGDIDNCKVLLESTRHLTQLAKKDKVAVIVPPNTVLFVGIGATVGKVAITNQEASFNQQLTAVMSCYYYPKYLMYWLFVSNEDIKTRVSLTTLPIINNSSLGQCVALIPPIHEQKHISDYLDSKCSEIDSIISDKQKQLDTLAAYRKSLIYEYVTGKKEVPIC